MRKDQFGESLYLSVYEEYDKVGLHKLFGDLYNKLDEAEQAGYVELHVVFESTIDPYDPYPGPVEVKIMGNRKLTQKEQLEDAEQKRIEALSKQLGITFYEASVVDRLKKSNKINL